MNKKGNEYRKRARRSEMTRKILIQYLLSLIGFAGFLPVAVIIAWELCSSVTWYSSDPMWHILNWVRDYIIFVVALVFIAGWVLITYHFISKPLRCLDQVVEASEQLAVLSETPILLPDTLHGVQDELNQVREQALRNAALAREAEQRKNDLIVYLAHDLKTPLTSVIGYLTLLVDEPQISDELREKYTGIALAKAERLEELINEFFEITRFNLTAMTLETETVNLSRMLEQIASEFQPILGEKELFLELSVPPQVEIVCDSDKLERVFDNLLRNAVNYSYPNTGITLSLIQKGSSVEVRVCNHGKTIPKEKLDRIFEQFFRLDSSRSSQTGGAGLGLAIAREIVELHKGSIAVQSADERIIFTVTLPVYPRLS